MEFEDLQNAWNQDTNAKVQLPTDLDKLKSARSPLAIIKKNLKGELMIQFLAIVLTGFVPLALDLNTYALMAYYLLYILSILILSYFTVRLWLYYKSFIDCGANTKDNLYEIYYNIRLFIETYKSLTYILMPFGIFYFLILVFGKEDGKTWAKLASYSQESLALISILGLTIFMFVIWLMTEAHTKKFYGKHADQIKQIINELKEV